MNKTVFNKMTKSNLKILNNISNSEERSRDMSKKGGSNGTRERFPPHMASTSRSQGQQ